MSIKEFINDLGGASQVSEALGCDSKRVYAWVDRNSVPYRHRPTLALLAAKRDVPLPTEIAEWAAPLAQPPAPITVGTDAASTEAS